MIWLAILTAVVASVLTGALAVVLRRTGLGQRREGWQEAVASHAGGILTAIFLIVLALAVVIAWQRNDDAGNHIGAEADALVRLSSSISVLDDNRSSRAIQAEIGNYVRTVIDDEWPRQAHGELSAVAGERLDRLHVLIASIPTTNPRDQAVRTEALADFRDVQSARQDRMGDVTSSFPTGLLVMVVITGVALTLHTIVMGVPHGTASLISLLTQTALLSATIYITFAVMQPFSGALDRGPGDFQQALTQLRVD